MKKVIKPHIPEVIEYICDKCGKESHVAASIKFDFGYGSEFDMSRGTLHFCQKCVKDPEELAMDFVRKYPTFKIEDLSF